MKTIFEKRFWTLFLLGVGALLIFLPDRTLNPSNQTVAAIILLVGGIILLHIRDQ